MPTASLLNRARIPLYSAVGLVTVLIAAGLGWLLAGPAIRPLRRLTEHTKRLGKDTERMPEVRGVREAEDLSEAMTAMLSRLAAAQQATTNSLQAAQDFAANAAHELRTPLTAMRADLDTLRIHDLPDDERAEVVQDLSRAQRRVEAIITALGQLASGQLAQAEDRELIDVTDLLDRVARENMRTGGDVEIVVEAADDLGAIWGWPGGLRLAVDNLVRNAVTHGHATRIVLAANRYADTMTIVVDDMYSTGTFRGSHFRTARIALSACARQARSLGGFKRTGRPESDPSGLKITLICATYVSPSGTPGGGVQQLR